MCCTRWAGTPLDSPPSSTRSKPGPIPRDTTRRNIERFRTQIESLGFSYDWSREIDTTDPTYVRWTQWIFQKLFENDLAYQAEVPVNWCPALGTVLANEEVIDGKSERGGHPVIRVPMKQWMLRITAYADRLLEDLEGLDWPEPIKKMQRDWIGRSEGAEVRFPLDAPHAGEGAIEVFTTRPDTLFGATYMVLAPEHELVARITTDAQRGEVEAYVEASRRKSERLRLADTREKTGVATGAFATNPCNGERIPVWIADYVLASYGTGSHHGGSRARRARLRIRRDLRARNPKSGRGRRQGTPDPRSVVSRSRRISSTGSKPKRPSTA